MLPSLIYKDDNWIDRSLLFPASSATVFSHELPLYPRKTEFSSKPTRSSLQSRCFWLRRDGLKAVKHYPLNNSFFAYPNTAQPQRFRALISRKAISHTVQTSKGRGKAASVILMPM